MRRRNQKVLAAILALSIAVQPMTGIGTVFAQDAQTEAVVTETETTEEASLELQNGTVVIKNGTGIEEVKEILGKALLKNSDGVDLQSLEWEYYCEGKSKLGAANDAWGSIEGFTSQTKFIGITTTYTHPKLAENKNADYQIRLKGMGQEVTVKKIEKLESAIVLKDGVTVEMGYKEDGSIDYDAVRQSIFDQVVESTTPEDLTVDDVTIEYYAEATTGSAGSMGMAWMPLEGGKGSLLTYPAMGEGESEIRVSYAGTDEYTSASSNKFVNFVKKQKTDSAIVLKDNVTVEMGYKEDGSIDYDVVRRSIFDQVVESTTPEGLTVDDVTIEYWARESGLIQGPDAWMPLEGGKGGSMGNYNYPAMGEGERRIKVSWGGSGEYSAVSSEAEVTFVEKQKAESVITLKENPTAKIVYNENLERDYDALRANIWENVVSTTPEGLTLDDVTIQYYAKAAVGPDAWVPLEGGWKDAAYYPEISSGTKSIRILYNGNADYLATEVKGEFVITDRQGVQFHVTEGSHEVGMLYNEDMSFNYDAMNKALFEALIDSTEPELTAEDITVEYNAGAVGVNIWRPLNNSNALEKKFGLGSHKIRFSWGGNQEYAGGSVEVDATITDGREVSQIVWKENGTMTYNADPNVMKEEIFNNLIDWEASNLPDKSELSLDDFTLQYYASPSLLGNVDPGTDLVKAWMGIEGGKVVLVNYPKMGAGEQKVRITYKGNAAWAPSGETETTINVAKANLDLDVHSTNIYANEKLSDDFITVDTTDNVDVYTIYGGATSNVSLGIYLDLPESFTDNKILKLIDPIVEKIFGKSFTQMMNDGVTVGELRKIFSTQELLDLLEKLNIDTGSVGKILEIINKMPGIFDGVRVSFGVPNRAGLYMATAVSNNPNYKTDVGVGMLLVKMRLKGVKLTWNESIPNGKISKADAANFDFGATVSYDGDVTISQDNVHYLYSGLTSKWRIYSSTTTPPTEPGNYICTVVTLGGNYQALPITRSFKITK